jgi:hypothetical protein
MNSQPSRNYSQDVKRAYLALWWTLHKEAYLYRRPPNKLRPSTRKYLAKLLKYRMRARTGR